MSILVFKCFIGDDSSIAYRMLLLQFVLLNDIFYPAHFDKTKYSARREEMKKEDMMALLVYLVEFMADKKKKDLLDLKKDKPWRFLDNFCLVSAWANTHVNTKLDIIQRIEEILKKLKLISHKECSGSDELRKTVLREIAELIGIKEYNHKISKNKLEELITGFVEASAQ